MIFQRSVMKIFVFNLFAWILSAAKADSTKRSYPVEWWAEVPRSQAASWEILPQEAGPGEVILSKRTELGLLSNFAPTSFELRGSRYASIEGFWQMMKYPENSSDERALFPGLTWLHSREEVGQMTAFEAKQAGSEANKNMQAMNINWVTFMGQKMSYYEPGEKGLFYQLIVEATKEKVLQNPSVMRLLLATGDLKLRPDHHQSPDSPPAWRYYEILTEIRSHAIFSED